MVRSGPRCARLESEIGVKHDDPGRNRNLHPSTPSKTPHVQWRWGCGSGSAGALLLVLIEMHTHHLT